MQADLRVKAPTQSVLPDLPRIHDRRCRRHLRLCNLAALLLQRQHLQNKQLHLQLESAQLQMRMPQSLQYRHHLSARTRLLRQTMSLCLLLAPSANAAHRKRQISTMLVSAIYLLQLKVMLQKTQYPALVVLRRKEMQLGHAQDHSAAGERLPESLLTTTFRSLTTILQTSARSCHCLMTQETMASMLRLQCAGNKPRGNPSVAALRPTQRGRGSNNRLAKRAL